MLGSVDTIRYILGVGQKVFSKCVVLFFFCGKIGGARFFPWQYSTYLTLQLYIPAASALPIVNLFTISIDFNQFQSISITFNPKFKWGLGLDRKSHILGEIGIWDCHNRNPSLLPRDDSAPFMYREIHKKVLCQNSQMLDLSYHISSEYTFSFSCLPQWARKYRKSSYSAVFFQKWD